MNSVFFFRDEYTGSTAKLLGERLKTFRHSHNFDCGQNFIACVEGIGSGTGIVTAIYDDKIEFDITLSKGVLDRLPVVLIVGVCRPQTVRKVINIGTTFGVEEIHFVRCANSQKSYLSSSALNPPEVEKEMTTALEQAVDCIMPGFFVHPRFKPFAEDILPSVINVNPSEAILADTHHISNQSSVTLSASALRRVLAVGPEAGWNDFERELFLSQGFKPIALGQRILRVETAVAALVGMTLRSQ
ncbi:MAG: RNA methyltransferase [Bdellovibrionales bacterium]|nr:RNA methyltransferase [Bdellovibrionales bacterium]